MTHDFVRWFRDSSPYIHSHRGRTFVISFGGEAIADGLFSHLAHDFALLNSLGIKLVLVHGIRHQIEIKLQARGLSMRYENGLRITDDTALECVKEAAGTVRVEIEALLSMGLSNSPMAGARVRVASGNFVIAKPLGVRDGIDFCHTGMVRRIDTDGLQAELEHGNVVLLSPIGYSPTGEIFNLSAEEVATAVAVALKADKLLLLNEADFISPVDGQILRQLTLQEASEFEADNAHLHAAMNACRGGVRRVHLLNRHINGAVLLELFTRDGVGTLVSSSPFDDMRQASIDDVGGILELIRPLEEKGILLKRSRERLEMEIDDYTVTERDGLITGCAALHLFEVECVGELACFVLHDDYRGEKRGEHLLAYIESKAKNLGLKKLFVLTTQATHWFREHGFEPAALDHLPLARQAIYNDSKRNSKVLFKTLF